MRSVQGSERRRVWGLRVREEVWRVNEGHKHWNRLLKEAESLSLEVLKRCVDMAPVDMGYWAWWCFINCWSQ